MTLEIQNGAAVLKSTFISQSEIGIYSAQDPASTQWREIACTVAVGSLEDFKESVYNSEEVGRESWK